KGALANIGAPELSAMAYGLEKAAGLSDAEWCQSHLPQFLERLRSLGAAIALVFEKTRPPRQPAAGSRSAGN
ncbi:MAG: hypothetical protein FWF22_06940, partial [Treponema sp.]|nr:hypothetical protein [Treponema sp.]